jgi:hypothetical protein
VTDCCHRKFEVIPAAVDVGSPREITVPPTRCHCEQRSDSFIQGVGPRFPVPARIVTSCRENLIEHRRDRPAETNGV